MLQDRFPNDPKSGEISVDRSQEMNLGISI
jgi:hypothetical protein